MKIFNVIKFCLICCAVSIWVTGCKIQQQEYNRFKVGEIYQTEVDAYVVLAMQHLYGKTRDLGKKLEFCIHSPQDWMTVIKKN